LKQCASNQANTLLLARFSALGAESDTLIALPTAINVSDSALSKVHTLSEECTRFAHTVAAARLFVFLVTQEQVAALPVAIQLTRDKKTNNELSEILSAALTCVCVCVYIYIHIDIYRSIHIYIYISTSINKYILIYVFIYINTNIFRYGTRESLCILIRILV